MTFTADDLRRLKECVHPVTGLQVGLFHPPQTTMIKIDLVALLTRLEAAERVISNFATENASSELSNAYIAWRKECGK